MLAAVAVAAEGGVTAELFLQLFILLHELEIQVLALEKPLLCYLELEKLVLLSQPMKIVRGSGVVIKSLGCKDA